MIKSKLPNVGATIFSVMSALAAKHNAVNLSQGFPDFPIDDLLKDYVKEAMDENQVQYAPLAGRFDLRLAISNKIKLQHDVFIDPNDEITITAGATQGIYTAIATLIDKGDEVILFDPAYDCYDPAIRVHKGIPIHLNLKHPNYATDWEELGRTITDKTKLIIFNNPHNPSGAIWSKDDLLSLEKIIEKHPNLYILSDEVYEHIQYRGEHQSVLKSKLLRERAIVCYSFGKSMHVTGWKLGYVITPADFMIEFRKIHQYLVFCANNTMQYAVMKYLIHGPSYKEIAPFYQRKRDLFLSQIQASRFKILPCDGTYFLLLDYSAISDLSDIEFAKKMTIDYGVAVIPVSVFYQDKTDHKVVRICFAKTDETLLKAAKLLCRI
ncbi:methionine aminotransferase [Crocinitomix sp.]|nr:methionine aminotransferase [Crocinitomix sp.]